MIPLPAIPGLWKLGAVAAVVAVLGAGHFHRVHQADRAGYDRAVSERAAADLTAVVARMQDNAVVEMKQRTINEIITKAKNEELAPVVQRIYIDRVRVGPAICGGPASAPAPESTGGGDRVDPPGGLVRSDVERDLRALMVAVEQDLATGRACQRFINDNGLVP